MLEVLEGLLCLAELGLQALGVLLLLLRLQPLLLSQLMLEPQ